MNGHPLWAALALAAAGSLSAAALPAPAAVLESAPRGTVVFDDDGGRAQIVPRREVARTAASYHGGPAISRGSVHAIFLGKAWQSPENRRRETQIMGALASRGGSSTFPSLAPYRLAAPELQGPAHEDLADPRASGRISDLQIQARLDRGFTGPQPKPLAATGVYVVFLAPGIRSTLGASDSAKDYAAYHNHFHSAAGVVHYAVVPYDDDSAHWLANAQQALVEALINPEGNGWY